MVGSGMDAPRYAFQASLAGYSHNYDRYIGAVKFDSACDIGSVQQICLLELSMTLDGGSACVFKSVMDSLADDYAD